jgi:hypothetical protein
MINLLLLCSFTINRSISIGPFRFLVKSVVNWFPCCWTMIYYNKKKSQSLIDKSIRRPCDPVCRPSPLSLFYASSPSGVLREPVSDSEAEKASWACLRFRSREGQGGGGWSVRRRPASSGSGLMGPEGRSRRGGDAMTMMWRRRIGTAERKTGCVGTLVKYLVWEQSWMVHQVSAASKALSISSRAWRGYVLV